MGFFTVVCSPGGAALAPRNPGTRSRVTLRFAALHPGYGDYRGLRKPRSPRYSTCRACFERLTSGALKPHGRLAISLIPLNYIRKNNTVKKWMASTRREPRRKAGICVDVERVYDL